MAQAQYTGTGRRKNAVARVRLVPGTGKITVNKKDVEEYIPHADLRLVINQPFAVTSTEGSYDVHVNVVGGGYAGQSGAIRHGIARALLQVDPDFRDSLKRAGLLTRDARMVERKKPGLKKGTGNNTDVCSNVRLTTICCKSRDRTSMVPLITVKHEVKHSFIDIFLNVVKGKWSCQTLPCIKVFTNTYTIK